MTILLRTSFSLLALMSFAGLLFGQEMTPQQKQTVEKLERQNKIEEARRVELKKQLGINESQKIRGDFYREEGVGLTTKNISQGRDLSQYEKGGHIDCRKWAKSDEFSSKCTDTALRDFIWQMWSEKKRGYITISGDSVDAGATSHFFIEPDKKGNFQIIERIVRWSALPGSGYSVDDFPVIVSVERIESKTLQVQWILVLKDKSGKTTKYGY